MKMNAGAEQGNTGTIIVNVPLKIKRRSGRKEVILAEEPDVGSNTHFRPAHQEALVIAIARAYRWQKLLDEGKFASISDLAREIGLDVSFAARLLRLTLLAPDIVETILAGEEPEGLSLTRLTQSLPMVWQQQRIHLGITRDHWMHVHS
jgi:hypothetical protein